MILDEAEVVKRMLTHLQQGGWTIQSWKMPHETGVDIVATQAGVRLEVEAKGEGSSRRGSARYGQRFRPEQVRHRIGEALLTTLATVTMDSGQVAIAVPDVLLYQRYMGPILPRLRQLGIIVFWVGESAVRETR